MNGRIISPPYGAKRPLRITIKSYSSLHLSFTFSDRDNSSFLLGALSSFAARMQTVAETYLFSRRERHDPSCDNLEQPRMPKHPGGSAY